MLMDWKPNIVNSEILTKMIDLFIKSLTLINSS